ncbi:uncharacterized protein CG4449 isoform X2 [Anopheles stephensi]|nr:uncharacterized protein CG4449 isoform X2 [Anopheles stephensi]
MASSVVPSAATPAHIDLTSNVSVEEEMQLIASLFHSIFNSKNPSVMECLKNRDASLIKRSFTMLSNSYNRKPPVTANDVSKLKKKMCAVRNNLSELDRRIKSVIPSAAAVNQAPPRRSSRRSRNATAANQAPIVISLDCDDDDTPIASSAYPYNRPVANRSTANDADTITLDSDDELSNRANNSFETENYEMRVKVKWGLGIETFVHRRYQKFADIIGQLAAKESADSACIFLNLDDRIVYPTDTPDSISYKPHQFISGRILKSKAPILPSAVAYSAAGNSSSITLKVQMATRKQPLRLQMEKSQTMSVLAIKCAEELKCAPKDIRLYFDGELVDNGCKPEDLDLEGDEILDIRVVQ